MARSRPRSWPCPFDRVPENLAERRGVRRQVRDDPLRQKRAGQCQPLGNALAGEVEVDVVLEDDIDHREVEFARRPHAFDARQALQVDRQRIRDLIFDLARAAAHPIGEHDHLIFGEIGNGVDRRVDDRINPQTHHDQRRDEHHEAIADRELDDFFNHEFSLVVRRQCLSFPAVPPAQACRAPPDSAAIRHRSGTRQPPPRGRRGPAP